MNFSISTLFSIAALLLFSFSNPIYGQNKPVNHTPQQLSSELPTSVYPATTKVNYFRTYDFLKGIKNLGSLNTEIDNNHILMTTEYFDGLSRPIQKVAHKYLPGGIDQVGFTYYDALGRQVYESMPYGVNSSGGEMRLNPTSEMNAFLSPVFPSEDIFYNKNTFDTSPLNQIRKKIGTGNSWTISNRSTSTLGRPNLLSDNVKILSIDLSSSGSTSVNGNYSTGALIVTVSFDENGNQTREFVNRRGELILNRVQVSTLTPTQGEGTDWLSTYYVYDGKGLLRQVFPPQATKILEEASNGWSDLSIVNELVFYYQYDDRGRLIEKKIPSADLVEMVYDKSDRLIATRDANQRDAGQWLITKYDGLNRPVLTGIYANSNNREVLQAMVDNWNNDPVVRKDAPNEVDAIEGLNLTLSKHVTDITKYIVKTGGEIVFLPGFDSNGEEFETEVKQSLSHEYTFYQGYYDASFPLIDSNLEVLSVSYFDDYSFTSQAYDLGYTDFYPTGGVVNAVIPTQYTDVTGIATGSKLKVLGSTDEWLTTVMYYDDRGREIQSQTDNHLGGRDISTTQYDFSGKVLGTHTVHNNPNATPTQTRIAKRYTYDAGTERLLTIEEKLDNTGNHKVIVSKSYSALGQLESKVLGNNVETLNYGYNIRGWLESINEAYVAGTATNHYFGMELSYDHGFTTNQFNGNIAGVKWKSASSQNQRAYGFDYDATNRITKADYTEGGNWLSSKNNFSTTYGYDANGNLLSLMRKGVVAGSIKTIDDLQYDYGMGFGFAGNSNRLLAVSDAAGDLGQGDFVDGNSGTDYAYDVNGNMTQDLNKDIQGGNITYNYLNLPKHIEFGNNAGKSITYAYDASGIKLKKTVKNGGIVTVTDYVGGFIYENNRLLHFAHEEGRVRKNYQGNLVYDFFIKDHLDNTRMTLTEEVQIVPTTYLATMEVDYRQWETDDSEGLGFGNISTSNAVPNGTANKTVDLFNELPPPAPNMVLRTNGSYTNLRIGANKMIKVMTDDVVSVEAYATTDNIQNGGNLSAITASILSVAFGGASGGGIGGEAGAIYEMFNSQYPSILAAFPSSSSSKASAYLNWILFDEAFEVVTSGTGFDQVSNGVTKEHLQSPSITVASSGYFYIYVSNEGTQDVYFDDVRLEHTRGKILQEDHYYPFGMNINALSTTAPFGEPNTFNTFQGQEKTTEFDLGWVQFKWRNHDPQTGRFFNIDPLAESYYYNSPYAFSGNMVTAHIELEGLEPMHYMRGLVEHEARKGYIKNGGNTEVWDQMMLRLSKAQLIGTGVITTGVFFGSAVGAIAGTSAYNTAILGAGSYGPEVIGIFAGLAGYDAEIPGTSGDNLGKLIRSGVGDALSYFVKLGDKPSAWAGGAELIDNVLELDFSIPSGSKGKGLGTAMFDDALKYFEGQIEGIQGLWIYGDNLSSFNKAIESGKSLTEAAFSTATGKWAKKNGFGIVEIIRSTPTENGTFSAFEVLFRPNN